ncbi:MAG: hypothetical protein HYY59_03420 [Candidatus Omnitrophica bacterium]|nr:hypothetical protein [Candidatus Omnitrophota bacterium]
MNEVEFDFRRGRIVVRGQESGLLKLAQAAKELAPHLKEIRIIGGAASESDDEARAGERGQGEHPLVSGRKPAIREFAKSLPLANTYERIAALIYHAIKIEKKNAVSIKELEDWFSLCGFKKPRLMRIAVYDAKRKYGYVESRGKDQWTISTGGENVLMEKLEK